MQHFVQSPFNYTGGKHKLLPQIEPLFPQDISTFVDIFCGGGNVGANVKAQKIIYNDSDDHIIKLLQLFKKHPAETIISKVQALIKKYNLSDVKEHGYDFYRCNSADGLANYNKLPFKKLRDDFNERKVKNDAYFFYLYTLIVFSFNNQLRFNKEGKFNLPVGKRDFNSKMIEKITEFGKIIQSQNNTFSSFDFRKITIDDLPADSIVYADPPYLITCASYNENDGWTEKDELALYNYLDKINQKQIRFALSNVLSSKGKQNFILEQWLTEHPEYYCHHLQYSYSNSNYQTKDKTNNSDEILVTNYNNK